MHILNKEKPVIYLDMDGVCTDFTTAAIIANGKNPKDVFNIWNEEYKNEFLPYIVMGLERDYYWQSIHNCGEKFWIELNEYNWFSELYNSLIKITDVVFLSATTRDGGCLSGKLKWLQKRYGIEYQDYIFTSHKYRLANRYSILIDDYHINVSQFREYGGNAILFPQLWNSNHSIKDKVSYTLEEINKWYNRL